MGIDSRSLRSGPAGIATCVRNLRQEMPWLQGIDSEFPRNNFLWNQLRPPLAQIRRRWQIYHAPSYTAPLLNFSKLVVMAADVSYLACEQYYPYPIGPFRRWYYRASLLRADRIIVTSDYTREEIVRLFPSLSPRIRRIYPGVSARFRRDPSLALRAREELDLPQRFALHVGDVHPRRNVELLLEACGLIDLPLVLVGKVLRGGEALENYPLRFSGLSLDLLVGVYSAASVLGYPSLYEGFGFPPVEAMACGLPVAAAARSCLPEVCGDAAVLVEPQAEALAQGLQSALSRAAELTELGLRRAQRFEWKRAARETEDVYRELAP